MESDPAWPTSNSRPLRVQCAACDLAFDLAFDLAVEFAVEFDLDFEVSS
jgi:hypothetical protein